MAISSRLFHKGIKQMALEHEQEITNRRNVPRFFVEHPHISWIFLLGVLIWGWFGYTSMPQRKDPDIPVRLARRGLSMARSHSATSGTVHYPSN